MLICTNYIWMIVLIKLGDNWNYNIAFIKQSHLCKMNQFKHSLCRSRMEKKVDVSCSTKSNSIHRGHGRRAWVSFPVEFAGTNPIKVNGAKIIFSWPYSRAQHGTPIFPLDNYIWVLFPLNRWLLQENRRNKERKAFVFILLLEEQEWIRYEGLDELKANYPGTVVFEWLGNNRFG